MTQPDGTPAPSLIRGALLSREDLIGRWQCGSASTFHRAEADGLLVPRRRGRVLGYRWADVWAFEGGLPAPGMVEAYMEDLLTPAQGAAFCPLKPATLIAKAGTGEIPCRRIGRFVRFVPAEFAQWLEDWS